MKHRIINHFSAASLIVLALCIFGSSASFGAVDAYIVFKSSDGRVYKATPDASGKFTFTNVQPGTYSLLLMGSNEYFAAKKKNTDKHKDEIEIYSFSWGASSSTISSSGSGSSGSTARESSAPSVSEVVVTKSTDKSTPGVDVNTGRVKAADVNGDGMPDVVVSKITSPKTVSLASPVQDGASSYVVILQNVVVTAACSPSGSVSNFAIKENGVK